MKSQIMGKYSKLLQSTCIVPRDWRTNPQQCLDIIYDMLIHLGKKISQNIDLVFLMFKQ